MALGGTAREQRALVLALAVALPLTIFHGLSNRNALPDIPDVPRLAEMKFIDVEYRARRKLLPERKTDPRLIFINYDDDTDQLVRREYASGWHFYAALLGKLKEAQPRVVFFDVLLLFDSKITGFGAEIDRLKTELSAQGKLSAAQEAELSSIRHKLNLEVLLHDGLAGVPTVIPLACFGNTVALTPDAQREELERLHSTDAFEAPAGATHTQPIAHFDYPHDQFRGAAAEIAQTCELFDADGVLRNDLTMIETWRDGKRFLLPSVSTVMARWAMGLPREAMTADADGLNIGELHIPTDAWGRTLIGYQGDSGTFAHHARQGQPAVYTAKQIVSGAVPLERLKDKVLFFGSTITGSSDMKRTPFSTRDTLTMPGVEKVITQTDALLSGAPILHRPRILDRWGFLLTALVSILSAALGATLPIRRLLLVVGAEFVLLIGGAIALFTWRGLQIDVAFPAISGAGALLVAGTVRYIEDLGERQFLEQAFGKYLSPEMVKSLVAGGEKELKLEGRPAELTMLFADLRGFTSKSELISSEEMVKLLNEHLTAMSEVILRHGGTLDKFIGDCVMAFWGAPIPDSEHALHACEAGLEMLEVLASENEKRRLAGRLELDIGVGIASGPVTVGNMGSIHRFDYTVIGDAVNTASRLEGLTKEAGYGCVIGERTVELVKGRIPIDALGTTKVKGKAAPVPIFGLSATRRAKPEIKAG